MGFRGVGHFSRFASTEAFVPFSNFCLKWSGYHMREGNVLLHWILCLTCHIFACCMRLAARYISSSDFFESVFGTLVGAESIVSSSAHFMPLYSNACGLLSSSLPSFPFLSAYSFMASPTSALSSTAVSLIPQDWTYSPENKFLFRDAEAFHYFHNSMNIDDRLVIPCYYLNPAGVVDPDCSHLLRDWVEFWDLRSLVSCHSSYHPQVTKLFYANLRISYNHHNVPYASSFLFGRILTIGLRDLATFLGAQGSLKEVAVYTYSGWPRDCGSRREYRRWFKFRADAHRGELTTAFLPALHRTLFMIITHILLPRNEFSPAVTSETLFYLRHFIARDKKINIAHIMIRHMHYAAQTRHAPLPYGHIIEDIMRRAGIHMPDLLWGKPITSQDVSYPRNLVGDFSSFGWVAAPSWRLIPDPGLLVNSYIMQLGAAPNQYQPLREGSPPSDGESTAECSGPLVDRQLHVRLEAIEAKLDKIISVICLDDSVA